MISTQEENSTAETQRETRVPGEQNTGGVEITDLRLRNDERVKSVDRGWMEETTAETQRAKRRTGYRGIKTRVLGIGKIKTRNHSGGEERIWYATKFRKRGQITFLRPYLADRIGRSKLQVLRSKNTKINGGMKSIVFGDGAQPSSS